jgi:hypothetical protein
LKSEFVTLSLTLEIDNNIKYDDGLLSFLKMWAFDQSLVGLVVIDIELWSEDHGSISHNCDREGAGTTW